MSELFIRLVNMSISASWLALAVMVLRLLLRKAPRWLWPALWGCVGLRLVCPFTIESALSLLPAAETVSPDIVYQTTPAIHSGVGVIDAVVNPVVESLAPPPDLPPSVNPLQSWLPILALLWAAGVAGMLAWAGVSWLRLCRQVKTAVLLREEVYESEFVDTPFILGLFRPRIYLPLCLPEGHIELVVAHERTHLARKDHWIKPLGFLLLCVYWFNPILWAAYVLLCRDIELACDERVIQNLTVDRRADYSQALLSCSAPRRTLAACPLAFGEVGVKERVKHVLNYKKPALWLVAAAVVCCAVVAVCFLTDPPAPAEGEGTALTGEQIPKPAPGEAVTPSGGPEAETPAELTQETAERTIAAVLGSLRVTEDQTVTFSIPEELPVSEDGKTRLTVTLNASYRTADGSYAVDPLLYLEADWTGGQVYEHSAAPRTEGSELAQLMLRAAYLTDLGGGSYRDYAANYVELKAPFFEAPIAAAPSVELSQAGRELTAGYLLRDGSQFSLSLTLPEGLAAYAEVETPADSAAPRVLLLNGTGTLRGSLELHPLATDYPEELTAVDTAADELPMQIFAVRALSNHADYEDYTVVRHWDAGAAATARYVWQDLSTPGYEGAAVNIPFQGADCVLAYDWSVAPCFAELLLKEGAFSAEEITAIAESVALH